MPQAVAAWATGYASFSAALAAGAGAAAAYAAVYVVAFAGLSLGLSKLSASLVGRPKGPGGMQSRKIVIRDSVHPRTIVYGETVTGGVLCYINTSGYANEYLDFVIAVAGHEITEITDVWFDDEMIPGSAIEGGDPVGGEVGDYYNNDISPASPGKFRPRDGSPVAYIRKFLGTDSQTAGASLTFSYPDEWSTDHRLRGVAYVHIRLIRNADAYPNGPPANFRFRVKGAKVYDPRLDSTNGGAGTHRVDDPSTWAYSNNPALCVADYLIGGTITNVPTRTNLRGFGARPEDVDWVSVAAAASICDESVAIPPESPATTQARYAMAGAISMGEVPAENLEQLLTSMLGQLVYSSGQYRLYAGAYDTPTLTLDEDDLAGPLSYMTGAPRSDRFNAVKGTRWDAATGQEFEFLPRTSATYELADGARMYRDIELPFTDNEYRAQRIAQIILRRSREQQTLIWKGNLGCLRVGVWETVYVSVAELGIVSKAFRCVSRRVTTEGDDSIVELTLREENSTTYSDPLLADYGDLSPADPQPTQSDALNPPALLTAASISGGILFTITPDDTNGTNVQYEIWEYGSQRPVELGTKIWAGAVTSVAIPKSDQVTRYYWVRARRNSSYSAFYPSSTASPLPAGVPGYALESGAGPQGEPGVSVVLTRVHASLLAYADGTVLTFDNADGYMRLYEGGAEVDPSQITFSVIGQAGCTGTINTATGVPVGGEPAGYYRVTSMSADEATLSLRATYKGTNYEAWFTLSKVKAGYEIVNTLPVTNLFNGRMVFLTSDGRLWRYSTVDSPQGWTTAVPATDITGELEAAQIAAGAIEASKFAPGLKPVEVLPALPTSGNSEGRTVYLTGDGKLYRYSLASSPEGWTNQVDGADIAANSITAGQIAAGAIRAEALLIRSSGAALNFDPEFVDSSAWEFAAGYVGTAEFATVSDGKVGNNVARNVAAQQSQFWSAQRVPLDPAKTYRVRCWARTISGSGSTLYMGIRLEDSAGANIAGDGTYWYYAASGVTPAGTWTEYTGRFGAGTAKTIPANARTMQALLILGYATGSARQEVQDLRIEEVLPSTLIADGAITTDKIAANSITAAKIQAGTITSNEILAGSITGDRIQAGTITAARMATNTITALSGVIADAAITNAKIANLSVDTLKLAGGAVTTGAASGAATTSVPHASWFTLSSIGAEGSAVAMEGVLITVEISTSMPFFPPPDNGPQYTDVNFRLVRAYDSAVIRPVMNIGASSYGNAKTIVIMDTAPPALATITYYAQVQGGYGTGYGDATVSILGMTAVGMKR